MKVAVIGSRGLSVSDLGRYLPENTTEIVSGGAKGVDTSARKYALAHGIKENPEEQNSSLTTAANSAWRSEFTLWTNN